MYVAIYKHKKVYRTVLKIDTYLTLWKERFAVFNGIHCLFTASCFYAFVFVRL